MNKNYVISGYQVEGTTVEVSEKAVENYKSGIISFETLLGSPEYFTEAEFKTEAEAKDYLNSKKTELSRIGNSDKFNLEYFQLCENYAYPDDLESIEDSEVIASSGNLEK